MKCEHCGGDKTKGNHTACDDAIFQTKYPFLCPKCNGTGGEKSYLKRFEKCCQRDEPYSSRCGECVGPTKVEVRVPAVPCDLCDGLGRLKKEPVPIVKTIGWKRG